MLWETGRIKTVPRTTTGGGVSAQAGFHLIIQIDRAPRLSDIVETAECLLLYLHMIIGFLYGVKPKDK